MADLQDKLAVHHHLELVRVAVEIQEQRLIEIASTIRGGPDDEHRGQVEAWLTAVVLRHVDRVLLDAAEVAGDRRHEIERLRSSVGWDAIRHVRDAYEHMDKYLAGKGNRQATEPDRPWQIFTASFSVEGPIDGGVSKVELMVADAQVEIPATTRAALEILNRVEEMLGVPPPLSDRS